MKTKFPDNPQIGYYSINDENWYYNGTGWEQVNPTHIDSVLSSTSKNAVQNRAITEKFNSLISEVSGHPVTTDQTIRITIGSGTYELNVKKIIP